MESIAPTDGPYIVYEGKKLLSFSSCDFLGLAQHPEVKKGAIKYALKYGVSGGARSAPQKEVEAKLAHYLGKETACLFSATSELENCTVKAANHTYLLGITGPHGFETAAGAICGALLCGSGAFIAGSKKQLSNTVSGAVSFPSLGALDCALSLIPEMEEERKVVQKHRAWLTKLLKQESPTPLITIQSEKAADIQQFFLQEQIYLAKEGNTLHFALTALHTPDDLDQLATSFKKFSATDLARSMQSLTPTP